MSSAAQQQHADVSGPSLLEVVSLNTSTSPVEGESSTQDIATTVEVPVPDAAYIPARSEASASNEPSDDSDDELIENIDTRSDPRIVTLPSAFQGEPSQVPEELPSAIQGEPQSLPILQENPALIDQDVSTGCS